MKKSMKCFNCGEEIQLLKLQDGETILLNSFLDDDDTLSVICPDCGAVMGTEPEEPVDPDTPF